MKCFWIIDCDPTQLTGALREPASIIACMVAVHRGKLDGSEQALTLGLKSRNEEIVTRGVMSKNKPIECLLLVNRLFQADAAFLAETSSTAALDTLVRFASEEARRGKLPLDPRTWGGMLHLLADR